MGWKRRRVLGTVLGIGATALAGCLDDGNDRSLPETPTGTWQQFAHDAGNTSTSDVAVPERGTPAWESGESETSPPIVAGDTVFSVDESLRALDAQTGDEHWSVDLDVETSGPDVASPAVTKEEIVLGVGERLVAFAREDGAERWETAVDGRPRGPVTASESTVVVPVGRVVSGEERPELVGVDIDAHDVEWRVPMHVTPRTTPPAVVDGRVYATGYTREDTAILRAVDAADGEVRFERELDAPETPPVVAQSGVFLGDDGTLAAYDRSGETLERSFDLSEGTRGISAIAVAEETAFVLSNAELAALSATNGSKKWSRSVDPQADGLCVGTNSVVAPVSSEEFDLDTAWPCIAAFDRADGTTRWFHALDDAFDPAIGAPPVIADGAVFYVSNTTDGIASLGDLPPEDEGE